jgi:hypothetical protein
MSQDYIQDSYHYYDSSIITYPALSGGPTTKFPFKVAVVNAADPNQNPDWKITVGDGFVVKDRLTPIEFEFDGNIRFDIQVADTSPVAAEQGIVYLELDLTSEVLTFNLKPTASVTSFPEWKPYQPENALDEDPRLPFTHSRYPLAVVEQRGTGASIQWFVYQLVYTNLAGENVCLSGNGIKSFLPL